MVNIRKHLDRYLSLGQAQTLLELESESVVDFINNGVIHAIILPDGSIGVSLSDIQSLIPRDELPDYRDYADLKNTPISISDASRKYGIHTSTLTRWMQRGYIAQIGKDGRKTLLNEADVAYCSRVYLSDGGKGKWVFDEKGRPAGVGKRRQRGRE